MYEVHISIKRGVEILLVDTRKTADRVVARCGYLLDSGELLVAVYGEPRLNDIDPHTVERLSYTYLVVVRERGTRRLLTVT